MGTNRFYLQNPSGWARFFTLLDLVDKYTNKGMYEVASIYKKAADMLYSNLNTEQE